MFVEYATCLFLNLKSYLRSRIVSKLWTPLAGGPLSASWPQNASCTWYQYLLWKSRRIWDLCFEFCPLVCLIWSMLCQHWMKGNGVLCFSPGSWEKEMGGNQLAASSLCSRFPLRQIFLKQDTWEGGVTSYDRKCWPSCLIQICLKGTRLSQRSTNLCCLIPPQVVAASPIIGGSSSQLHDKPRTVLLGFKCRCLVIPDLLSYYRLYRPGLLNSDPIFNQYTAIMAPQAQCLPWKITHALQFNPLFPHHINKDNYIQT